MSMSDIRTYTRLVVHKARLDADDVMLAAIDRAVVEIMFMVRQDAATYLSGAGECSAAATLLAMTDRQHEGFQALTRDDLMDALRRRGEESRPAKSLTPSDPAHP